MKTPSCCKKFMELKAVRNITHNSFPDEAEFYFQCKKCGKIERVVE